MCDYNNAQRGWHYWKLSMARVFGKRMCPSPLVFAQSIPPRTAASTGYANRPSITPRAAAPSRSGAQEGVACPTAGNRSDSGIMTAIPRRTGPRWDTSTWGRLCRRLGDSERERKLFSSRTCRWASLVSVNSRHTMHKPLDHWGQSCTRHHADQIPALGSVER